MKRPKDVASQFGSLNLTNVHKKGDIAIGKAEWTNMWTILPVCVTDLQTSESASGQPGPGLSGDLTNTARGMVLL